MVLVNNTGTTINENKAINVTYNLLIVPKYQALY